MRKRDKKKTPGSHAKITLILGALAFALLIAVSLNVHNSGYLTIIDARIAEFFLGLRKPGFVTLFTWISLFGGWQITFSLVFFFSLVLLIKRKTHYVLPLLITFALSELLSTFGKLFFQRLRPDSGVIELSSYAFPSGHSSMAMALYGFMIYVSLEQMRSKNAKLGVAVTGSILILAIGFSRLYLGVHFLSDVLGGYLLGTLCLIIGTTISNWLQAREQRSIYE